MTSAHASSRTSSVATPSHLFLVFRRCGHAGVGHQGVISRPMAVPSLELQCLYSLVGRLVEYSPQSLSLLPPPLRRQLLLRLPVADICRLENDPVFMSGLDSDAIWRGLLESRVVFGYHVSVRELTNRHLTAKDVYLTEVAICLLTSKWPWGRYTFPNPSNDYKLKADLISYFLYGTRLECGDMQDMCLFMKKLSLGTTWLVPHRYLGDIAVDEPSQILKRFLEKFNWYPKRLDLNENYDLDEVFAHSDDDILPQFMSCIENISICIEDYTTCGCTYAETLKPLWEAVARSSSLTTVSLSGCVTNLGSLVSGMIDTLFHNAIDKGRSNEAVNDESEEEFEHRTIYKCSGLKTIEVLGNDAGTHPHEHRYGGGISGVIKELIPFLDYQVGLESLNIEGLFDIYRIEDCDDERYDEYVSDYSDFEAFYNYLPYIINKSSFKLLRLSDCKIPVNSLKSITSTFLSRATHYHQSLEFIDCEVVDKSSDTYSEAFPLVNEGANIPCICGEFKSIRFCTDSSSFPLQWLFQYPKLRLKRLDLKYTGFQPVNLQSFDSYPSGSIDTLCVKLGYLGDGDIDTSKFAISKFLKFQFLSEIEIITMCCYEDPMFFLFTDSFMQPCQLTSLKRLRLQDINSYNNIDFRSFFDALFSRPKEQLAEFTLEILDVESLNQQDIFNSWKRNSRGQKLMNFKLVEREHIVFIEDLRSIAVMVTLESLSQ